MNRRGISLIEITAALVVVSLCTVMLTQLLVTAALHERRAEQRALARQSAANLLDEWLEWPWEALNAEASTSVPLTTEVAEMLPLAQCTVAVVAQASDDVRPASKQVIVTVSWGDRSLGLEESVRLVGWRFSGEESRP